MKMICGEVDATLVLRKEFDVLCITMRSSEEQEKRMKQAETVTGVDWHQAITGKMAIEVFGVRMGDVVVPAEVCVTFNDQPCEFLYFRTGLGGCVHVIAIRALEMPERHDVWELYTNELTPKGVEFGFDREKHVDKPHCTTDLGGRIFGGMDPAYQKLPEAVKRVPAGASVLVM